MTFLRHLLPLTALWAVLWAQAFGMNRGYFCEHTGSGGVGGHLTWADHCHIDDAHGHDDTVPHDDCGDHGHDQEHRQEHDAVVESLVARSLTLAKLQPPLPSLHLIDPAAFGFTWAVVLPPQATPPILASLCPYSRRCPQVGDWPRQLSQSIALRL